MMKKKLPMKKRPQKGSQELKTHEEKDEKGLKPVLRNV